MPVAGWRSTLMARVHISTVVGSLPLATAALHRPQRRHRLLTCKLARFQAAATKDLCIGVACIVAAAACRRAALRALPPRKQSRRDGGRDRRERS
jgi:hypothetical protein